MEISKFDELRIIDGMMNPAVDEATSNFDIFDDTKPTKRKRSSILKLPRPSLQDIENFIDDGEEKRKSGKRRVSFAEKFQVMEMHTGNIYDVSNQRDNSNENQPSESCLSGSSLPFSCLGLPSNINASSAVCERNVAILESLKESTNLPPIASENVRNDDWVCRTAYSQPEMEMTCLNVSFNVSLCETAVHQQENNDEQYGEKLLSKSFTDPSVNETRNNISDIEISSNVGQIPFQQYDHIESTHIDVIEEYRKQSQPKSFNEDQVVETKNTVSLMEMSCILEKNNESHEKQLELQHDAGYRYLNDIETSMISGKSDLPPFLRFFSSKNGNEVQSYETKLATEPVNAALNKSFNLITEKTEYFQSHDMDITCNPARNLNIANENKENCGLQIINPYLMEKHQTLSKDFTDDLMCEAKTDASDMEMSCIADKNDSGMGQFPFEQNSGNAGFLKDMVTCKKGINVSHVEQFEELFPSKIFTAALTRDTICNSSDMEMSCIVERNNDSKLEQFPLQQNSATPLSNISTSKMVIEPSNMCDKIDLPSFAHHVTVESFGTQSLDKKYFETMEAPPNKSLNFTREKTQYFQSHNMDLTCNPKLDSETMSVNKENLPLDVLNADLIEKNKVLPKQCTIIEQKADPTVEGFSYQQHIDDVESQNDIDSSKNIENFISSNIYSNKKDLPPFVRCINDKESFQTGDSGEKSFQTTNAPFNKSSTVIREKTRYFQSHDMDFTCNTLTYLNNASQIKDNYGSEVLNSCLIEKNELSQNKFMESTQHSKSHNMEPTLNRTHNSELENPVNVTKTGSTQQKSISQNLDSYSLVVPYGSLIESSETSEQKNVNYVQPTASAFTCNQSSTIPLKNVHEVMPDFLLSESNKKYMQHKSLLENTNASIIILKDKSQPFESPLVLSRSMSCLKNINTSPAEYATPNKKRKVENTEKNSGTNVENMFIDSHQDVADSDTSALNTTNALVAYESTSHDLVQPSMVKKTYRNPCQPNIIYSLRKAKKLISKGFIIKNFNSSNYLPSFPQMFLLQENPKLLPTFSSVEITIDEELKNSLQTSNLFCESVKKMCKEITYKDPIDIITIDHQKHEANETIKPVDRELKDIDKEQKVYEMSEDTVKTKDMLDDRDIIEVAKGKHYDELELQNDKVENCNKENNDQVDVKENDDRIGDKENDQVKYDKKENCDQLQEDKKQSYDQVQDDKKENYDQIKIRGDTQNPDEIGAKNQDKIEKKNDERNYDKFGVRDKVINCDDKGKKHDYKEGEYMEIEVVDSYKARKHDKIMIVNNDNEDVLDNTNVGIHNEVVDNNNEEIVDNNNERICNEEIVDNNERICNEEIVDNNNERIYNEKIIDSCERICEEIIYNCDRVCEEVVNINNGKTEDTELVNNNIRKVHDEKDVIGNNKSRISDEKIGKKYNKVEESNKKDQTPDEREEMHVEKKEENNKNELKCDEKHVMIEQKYKENTVETDIEMENIEKVENLNKVQEKHDNVGENHIYKAILYNEDVSTIRDPDLLELKDIPLSADDYEWSKNFVIKRKIQNISKKYGSYWQLRSWDTNSVSFHLLKRRLFLEVSFLEKHSSCTEMKFHYEDYMLWDWGLQFLLKNLKDEAQIFGRLTLLKVIIKLIALIPLLERTRHFVEDCRHIDFTYKCTLTEDFQLTFEINNNQHVAVYWLTLPINPLTYPSEVVVPSLKHKWARKISEEKVLSALSKVQPGGYYLWNIVQAFENL